MAAGHNERLTQTVILPMLFARRYLSCRAKT